MESPRKPIGKTLRFSIFKRDLFTCQYCGATPPGVVLEIDHVVPVSKGGDNDKLNLITSCFDCNRGKRDVLLSSIPEGKNIELLKEKEEQYVAYKKLQKSIKKRITEEINMIDSIYTEGTDGKYELSPSFKNVSVKGFLEKLGYDEVEDAMYIAVAKGLEYHETTKYFCGVCYTKIRAKGL